MTTQATATPSPEDVEAAHAVMNAAHLTCTQQSWPNLAHTCTPIAQALANARAAADPDRLTQLALCVRDQFTCACFTDDLPDGEPCPCGGDGRENADGDAGALEGCWYCQAVDALAERPTSLPCIENTQCQATVHRAGCPAPPCGGCAFANLTGATWDAVRHDDDCALVKP